MFDLPIRAGRMCIGESECVSYLSVMCVKVSVRVCVKFYDVIVINGCFQTAHVFLSETSELRLNGQVSRCKTFGALAFIANC